jgi:RNA 2',3'-cyclic 3'-phosphodiesterase
MRLFVAIPVEGEVAEVLGGLLERWQPIGWPVKWARPEGLHLTLKFLGSVESGRYPGLLEAVADAVRGTPALSFALSELGAFPELVRARVLWAGLESEAALELLVHRVERACAGLGFPLEGRPFRPHVTLGRVREGNRLPATALDWFETQALPRATFLSNQVVLYQSLTGAGGSRYEVKASFPLGEPA